MKLKLSYTSGVRGEIVDIGSQDPAEYIRERFGGGEINNLVMSGGRWEVVAESPVPIPEPTAQVDAPVTEVAAAPAKSRKKSTDG